MKSNLMCQLPARATGAANPSSDGVANALLAQLEAQTGVWWVVFPPGEATQVAASPCEARLASDEACSHEPYSHDICAHDICAHDRCAGRRCADRRWADRRWAGAQAELEQLHVEEFARLLALASALRAHLERRGAGAGSGVGASEVGAGDLGAVEVGAREVGGWGNLEALAWRTALADQRAAAAADGAQLSPALAACLDVCLDVCRAPLERWPSARQLALAAASLWPSARTRAALGRIALADGDWRAARGCFESALNFPASERLRGEVLAELDALAARELDSAGRGRSVSSTASTPPGSTWASPPASPPGSPHSCRR